MKEESLLLLSDLQKLINQVVLIDYTIIILGGNAMRKTRSDCTVGTFEKKHGLPSGTIRNKDGRDTRSDKKIGTIRKEAQNGK